MKFALMLLATLACIGWSAAAPAPYVDRPQDVYYPSIHTVVQGDGSRQRSTWQRSRVVDEAHQKPRKVYDYGMYESAGRGAGRRGPETRRLQLRDGSTVQYGQQRWPRTRERTHYTPTSQWREQYRTTTPAPTRLPPRLMLRSGDNVHFADGINWSIYKTDSGLTRVGTRDGEVVVRVMRPNYDRPAPTTTTTPRPRPTTQRTWATTPYQWQWQPCYTEQDCYRQYVNEYYRYYSHNQ